jgi:hypothetical protein
VETSLPTFVSGSWTVTGLRDSLTKSLASDRQGSNLALFFYAVTQPGWREVRTALKRWLAARPGRSISAYLGTDHGITDPDAIRQMVSDGVRVWLLQSYVGIFHPKLVWLTGPGTNLVWIGSNNLTRDGLLQNIEFSSLLVSRAIPRQLSRWTTAIHAASVPLSEDLLGGYEAERRAYGRQRAAMGTFTWSRREKMPPRTKRRVTTRRPARVGRHTGEKGDLVVEIMPRETGQDGKQIQLPIIVAQQFFGLAGRVGESRQITLIPEWARDPRRLTMTIFANHTVRLVIRELDYGDRPCVLVFRRRNNIRFSFDIVSRSTEPARYRSLLLACGAPTRSGSRRWRLL